MGFLGISAGLGGSFKPGGVLRLAWNEPKLGRKFGVGRPKLKLRTSGVSMINVGIDHSLNLGLLHYH